MGSLGGLANPHQASGGSPGESTEEGILTESPSQAPDCHPGSEPQVLPTQCTQCAAHRTPESRLGLGDGWGDAWHGCQLGLELRLVAKISWEFTDLHPK